MRSDSQPHPVARPPRWMPVGEHPDVCTAGQWWDAVRVPEAVGRRVIELLTKDGTSLGPVVLDADAREPRMYFLVPAGTAASWDEPETIALGGRCHVVIPPAGQTAPQGLHWHYFPTVPRVLTPPGPLRQALAKARRERHSAEGSSSGP